MTINSNSNIKYSVLIPTKNGGKYLKFAIESVLKQSFLNMELIISNNHSTDDTSEYLASLVDDRLKIISPNHSLPMAEHYEFMISHAKGEWVTIIGDDDAIMPYFFEYLERVIKKYPDTEIISSARAYYFWEGCIPSYGGVVINYKSSASKEIRSLRYDLLAALFGFRSCFDLPQLYTTSIVRRGVIEKVKNNQDNRFYRSIIPDMYSAVAFAANFKKYLRINLPLFWVGTSNKSMAISNRIYEESSLSLDGMKGALKLNKTIPQDIHAAGFGPMYLYECLLQCPSQKLIFTKKITILIIMGAVLRLINKKKYNIKSSKKKLLASLKNYLNTLELNYILVFLISMLLNVLIIIHRLDHYIGLAKIILYSRLKIKGYYYFVSIDRKNFSNINVAGDAVVQKFCGHTEI